MPFSKFLVVFVRDLKVFVFLFLQLGISRTMLVDSDVRMNHLNELESSQPTLPKCPTCMVVSVKLGSGPCFIRLTAAVASIVHIRDRNELMRANAYS